MNKEYRVIFYKDNRYNNVERYYIVEGKFNAALEMIKELKNMDFITYVSDYFTVNRQYVLDNGLGNAIKFKPMYKDMANEKFWNKNL